MSAGAREMLMLRKRLTNNEGIPMSISTQPSYKYFMCIVFFFFLHNSNDSVLLLARNIIQPLSHFPLFLPGRSKSPPPFFKPRSPHFFFSKKNNPPPTCGRACHPVLPP